MDGKAAFGEVPNDFPSPILQKACVWSDQV